MKAWRSKEHAQEELRGKANESYGVLAGFLHMLQKTNPGTIVHMETEDDNSFKYHCKNNRYSTMTSNIAESLNAANLAARELPITTLMESLRALIQQWTYTNRKKAQKTTTFLTPTAEKKLVDNFVDSLTENVKPINETMFEVVELTRSWVINLKEKTCSCNRFQLDELPCAHALAVDL
ncbi:uncharacterized protein LOC133032268 [Cannabis sativa]|uniref:uncharacterized protein LOC133032268 n=1 Tax=Cannabis sativa TaxID=3483 RepID=UPI0029CA6077|nr:uncharacterized protein LOC133032268 [Cannabis sativa]